ncbi:hypothetical protein N7541_005366 [Penicillium brevicompactum]|uniref:Uncharacterized protein n=1 Tax=Penicillium brevicompactum TaxID=5074 RepID=A0A9W9UUQ4_PENBR|nr:hypothetical protein N7541_005366 [Penicillium brevicompactum]
MPSMKTLFSVALALATAASASTITGGISNDNSKCPNNWVDVQNDNDERCCYGSLWTEDNDTYCCVRDVAADFSNNLRVRDESTDCYPFCLDTSDRFPHVTALNLPTGLPSCATKVPFTASDYSSLVSAASSSLAKQGPTTNSAGQTTTSFATSTASSGTTSTSSETGSSTESSTNAAMPAMTGGSVALGGAAVIGAMLAL